jgi:hypothetical protein
MKKLSLDLDALQVDTFDPSPAEAAARGTVRGNDTGPTTTFETLVETTTDPNLQCMCYSSAPCVETHETACGPDCV